MTQEKRRALRVILSVPAVIEQVPMPSMELHPNLAKVYQRVSSDKQKLGEKMPAIMRDLSTNGAFLAGEPMPLLSRVACSFNLEGFGQIEAIGWTLWRRIEDCEVPREDGTTVALPRGFGVLFEAIPLDARIAIHKLVTAAKQGVN